tara:strand:- start:1893 stop:2354 length:462 start_codon:yes stop_codon:yes gene_type:complete
MARKIFETETDRRNENQIANILANHFNVRMEKLPMSQRLDYAMQAKTGSKRILALCEIKCRSFKWGDFPDVMLSASKIKYAHEMFRVFNLKTLFVVCDRSNEIRMIAIHNTGYDLTFGGRTTNARDNQDSELIVNIPNEDFEVLRIQTKECAK